MGLLMGRIGTTFCAPRALPILEGRPQ
jgi:hypothetical protein